MQDAPDQGDKNQSSSCSQMQNQSKDSKIVPSSSNMAAHQQQQQSATDQFKGATPPINNKPSEENQRHSNKVTAIEVLLHQPDFSSSSPPPQNINDPHQQPSVSPTQLSDQDLQQQHHQQSNVITEQDKGIVVAKQATFSATVNNMMQNNTCSDEQQQTTNQCAAPFSEPMFAQKPDDALQSSPNEDVQLPSIQVKYISDLVDVPMPSMQEYGALVPGGRGSGLHQEVMGEYDQFQPGNAEPFSHQDHQQAVQHHHGHHSLQHDVVVDDLNGEDGGFRSSSLFPDGEPVVSSSHQQVDVGAMAGDQAQNDKRFYTLAELAEMEPQFERKFYEGGSQNQNALNAHVILSPQEYRAKLYWLDNENRWKDIGTGRFRLLLSKDEEEHYIQVVSEDCIDEQLPLDDVIAVDSNKPVADSVMTSSNVVETNSPQQANTVNNNQGSAGSQQSSQPKQVFLHRCFVHCLHEFSRQGDTIITWSDDYKNEFALSFQDEKGAQNTWWSICFLKGIQINSNIDEPNEAGGTSETNSISGSGVILPTKENLADLVNELYSTDAYTRRNIAEQVLKQEETLQRTAPGGGSSELSDRDHSKLQTWKSQYLDKLQKIFNEVEQQYQKATKAMTQNEGDEHDRCIYLTQQVNSLHSLFQIFRNLLNLNQSELLEVLLNEHYWSTTFGALEYDPEVFSPMGYKYGASPDQGGNGQQVTGGGNSPVGQNNKNIGQGLSATQSLGSNSPNSQARNYGSYDHIDQANQYAQSLSVEADFREFLSSKVKFKQAVEISDPQVSYSIHLSYKLQYLKDTAMARFIDENTSHTIMQLVSSLNNSILDYIFGEDFERVQAELIFKMCDHSNVEDKENALKFFLEICSLLKSTNLTNRQLQNCTNAFAKIMMVLAQVFDIMLPDKQTLLYEIKGDTEGLLKVYEDRSLKDQEKASSLHHVTNMSPTPIKEPSDDNNQGGFSSGGGPAREMTPVGQGKQGDGNQLQQNSDSGKEEESKDLTKQASEFLPGGDLMQDDQQHITTPNEQESLSDGNGQNASQQDLDTIKGPSTPGAQQASMTDNKSLDCVKNPGRSTVVEYLKSPLNSEDPRMTQIDALKSYSIEIFYNLLILLNNVSHSTIRDFLCSDHQKKYNYVFLRHLAQHMMYSSQQGIKVSICEFFKDLTSKETTEMQKNFQHTILFQVVSLFVEFLAEDDSAESAQENNAIHKAKSEQDGLNGDTDMKDEELKSQSSRNIQTLDPKVQTAFKKQIDQSRILILQFLNKLIVDNVDSYQLRHFFINNKVLMKVADCSNYNSIQTNVEVVKFFKAIVQTKDTMSINYMIKKSIFEKILDIFLNNKRKGNLLHSCILSLFEMLTPQDASSNQGNNAMLVMGIDNGYGGAPKTEGGYVQLNLLNKLYQRLYDNKYVKRVFLNKQYEDGFRKFNRSLRQSLDLHLNGDDAQNESDFKQASDRDRSNSQPRFHAPSRPEDSSPVIDACDRQMQNQQANDDDQDGDDNEAEMLNICFPGQYSSGKGDTEGNAHQQRQQQHESGNNADYQNNQSSPHNAQQVSDDLDQVMDQQQQHQHQTQTNDMLIKDSNIYNLKESDEPIDRADIVDSQDIKQLEEGKTKPRPIDSADANMQPELAAGNEEQQLSDGKPKQFLPMPNHSSQSRQRQIGKSGHSQRAARSMSPMSGHTGTAAAAVELVRIANVKAPLDHPSYNPFHNPNDGHSPFDGQEGVGPRRRRLSQDEFIGATPQVVLNKQHSGSSAGHFKSNLSDEANGSVKEANKSAMSETISNPDLDEIFFNKHTPVAPQPPSTLTFCLGGSGKSSLRLARQQSPGEMKLTSNLHDKEPISPNVPVSPFVKLHSGKKQSSSQRPKFERGRRACSEPPTARTELPNLTAADELLLIDQKQKEELSKLEAKLSSPLRQVLPRSDNQLTKHKSLEMCRNDSIGPQAAIGQKRVRQQQKEVDSDNSDGDCEGNIQENWVSKRPRLAEDHEQNKGISHNQSDLLQDERNATNDVQMTNPAQDSNQRPNELDDLLNASIKQSNPSKREEEKTTQ